MTASVLRVVEPARDEIRDRLDHLPDWSDRLPDLSGMDLPSLELLGKKADEAVDRLRGRSRRPAWPWFLGGAIVIGIAIAAASAVMTWSRNRTEPWPDDALEGNDRISEFGTELVAGADLPLANQPAAGLTAAEGSLLSYDPVEGRDA